MDQLNWKEIEKDVQKNRKSLIERLVSFSVNDVLLFWSSDKRVYDEQAKKWSNIISWANKTVNCNYKKTSTLEVSKENIDTSSRLLEYLNTLSDKELSGFYIAALNMRSVLLALALVKGKISASEAFELSELEELYQVRNWGSEPVAEARRNNVKSILLCAEKYLQK